MSSTILPTQTAVISPHSRCPSKLSQPIFPNPAQPTMLSTIFLTTLLSSLALSTPLSRRQEAGSAPGSSQNGVTVDGFGSTSSSGGNVNNLPSISPISVQNNAITCQSFSNLPSNFGQLCQSAAQSAESSGNNALSNAGAGTVPVPLSVSTLNADGSLASTACQITITPGSGVGNFATDGQSVTNILNQLVST